MTPQPCGEVTAAFPIETVGVYGLVRKIQVLPKAGAGTVSITLKGKTVKQFNASAATGPLDHPYEIGGPGDRIDPLAFAIVPDGTGNGAFVTYWAD